MARWCRDQRKVPRHKAVAFSRAGWLAGVETSVKYHGTRPWHSENTEAAGEVEPPSTLLTGQAMPGRTVCAPGARCVHHNAQTGTWYHQRSPTWPGSLQYGGGPSSNNGSSGTR